MNTINYVLYSEIRQRGRERQKESESEARIINGREVGKEGERGEVGGATNIGVFI